MLIVAILCVIGFAGWYVWQLQGKDKPAVQASVEQSSAEKQGKPAEEAPKADPYEGWRIYENVEYGVSFKYPPEWTASEGAVNSPASATKQQFAIGLKRSTTEKYSDTVVIEVLGMKLEDVADWYDNLYDQSQTNRANKTNGQLKGKSSIQYIVKNGDESSRLYLFSVGDKTYELRSVNEWLNLQNDADYWTKFQKVFDSLQIR
jgi:hypothetical protein